MLDLTRDQADVEADGLVRPRHAPATRRPADGGSDDLEFFVGCGLATLASAAFWATFLYGLANLMGLAG